MLEREYRSQVEAARFEAHETVLKVAAEIESMPSLDGSQKYEMAMAWKKSFTLLQGPPGTGKTHVIGQLVLAVTTVLYGKANDGNGAQAGKHDGQSRPARSYTFDIQPLLSNSLPGKRSRQGNVLCMNGTLKVCMGHFAAAEGLLDGFEVPSTLKGKNVMDWRSRELMQVLFPQLMVRDMHKCRGYRTFNVQIN